MQKRYIRHYDMSTEENQTEKSLHNHE
jgi:hypothetical protein